MAWLHTDANHTFQSAAGLTRRELSLLQLGFMIRQDRQNQQADAASGGETRRMRKKARAKRNAKQYYRDKFAEN